MKILLSRLLVCVALIMFGTSIASAAEIDTMSYVVKRGDTLTRIASFFHGTTWRILARTNKLRNPDLIFPGQRIIIRQKVTAPQQMQASRQENAVAVSPVVTNAGHVCDPVRAIKELHFPPAVAKALVQEVQQGHFHETTLVSGSANSSARRYAASDAQNDYTFIYPDTCAMRIKIVRAKTRMGSTETPHVNISDHDTRARTLPSSPEITPSAITTAPQTASIRQEKTEPIVLVRYLHDCREDTECQTHNAQGETFIRKEE